MKQPKIVFFDLETLMNLPEIAKKYAGISQWPGRSMGADLNSIISFGYKILGDDKAHCMSIWDFDKNWAKNPNDDRALLHFISDFIGDDTDAIVTHNGKRFDIKVLNTRLARYNLPPIHDIPHIDTCQTAKRVFKLSSNRLNDVAEFLGVEGKMQTGGWQLWVDVLNGDQKAAEKMEAYCAQDVEALYQVFEKMRPHFKNLPNRNLFKEGGPQVCSVCGSPKIQGWGYRRTKKKTKPRVKCMDCGSVRDSEVDKAKAKLGIA